MYEDIVVSCLWIGIIVRRTMKLFTAYINLDATVPLMEGRDDRLAAGKFKVKKHVCRIREKDGNEDRKNTELRDLYND